MAGPAFLTGSTLRHVLVMTSSAAVGLVAMFGVDLADMYFITMLDDQRLVAAVGFAGMLLYFLLSLGIGLQIALGALVARAEGGGERKLAGEYCTAVLCFNGVLSVAVSAAAMVWLPEILTALGASGETLEYALSYAQIQLPATPLLVLGMSMSAALRAVGDARRSMWVLLVGALVNGALDPIFIFALDWGIDGAAWASVAARFAVVAFAARALFGIHRLPCPVTPSQLISFAPATLVIALPAVLTNLATPLGGSLVLRIMSQFGDSAVAALTVMGRLAPLAFAAVFAVSGAVGPIVGQNAGACHYDRVRQTIVDAAKLILVYVLLVWLLLVAGSEIVIDAFSASDVAADLLRYYFHFLVCLFALNGLLFVANASFNNLGKAYLATLFNYAKVLLGIVPAAYLGATWYGARGVMLGEAIAAAAFGVFGLLSALALVRRMQADYPPLSAISVPPQ